MGTCQSRGVDVGGVATGFDAVLHKPLPETASAHSRASTKNSLILVLPSHKDSSKASSGISPSEKTSATAPETPSYPFQSPESKFSFVSPSYSSGGGLPNELSSSTNYDSAPSVAFENQSLNQSVIESVITEEVSLTAPSDEDDDILSVSPSLEANSLSASRQKKQKRQMQSRPPRSSGKALKRAEEAAQMRLINSRVTTPESIVFRPAPLIAPPKGASGEIPTEVVGPKRPKTSVNPQTIANFNRLKIQVELAEKNDLHERRKAKLEDRFEDVKGYRSLWKEFEHMKELADDTMDLDASSAKMTDKSMDLKESTSWYFDFRSLHADRHFQGDEADLDNRSQSSMSLLTEVTMQTQRKYFDQKQRERRKKKFSNDQKKPQKKVVNKLKKSRSFVSDEKSVTSARSVTSRGSAVFARGRTNNTSGGDYGPVREGDISAMDMPYDIGSDDSTPRTRTGRDMSRTSFYDEGASVISELDLDLDNDYNVPRRHRTRRHIGDDSSLDTFDGRSFEAGFSNVEFDMTNFAPRIHEDKNTGAEQTPATEKAMKLSSFPYRSTPRSRVEQYGFDPSAPLSSQLETFAQSVPTTETKDTRTGIVRLGEFPDTDTKKPNTPRRLDGLFVEDDGHEGVKKISPESIQSPSVMKLDYSQPGTLSDTHDHPTTVVPVNITIERNTPEPRKRSSNLETPSSYSHSPYNIMSPSQFRMMSSFHDPSYASDTEKESNGEQMMIQSNQKDDVKFKSRFNESEPEEDLKENETSRSKSSGLKTYDPTISVLSTEAFLRMSSWHNRPLSLECEPLSTDLGNDHDSAVPNHSWNDDNADAGIPDLEIVDSEKSGIHEEQFEVDYASPNALSVVETEDISNRLSDAVDVLLDKFRSRN
jgi:hypothetical protein